MKSFQNEFEQNKRKRIVAFTILFVVLVIVFLLGILLGSTSISLKDMLQNLGNKNSTEYIILTKIRLPRVLGGIFAGIGLALAGVILQSLMQNELVSPQTIGVSSGAGFSVVLFVSFFGNLFGFLQFFAFLGAFLASLLVYFISKKCGNTRYTLLLAGIAISALFQALSKLFYVFYPDSMVATNDFLIGSLANLSMERILPGILIIIISSIFVFLLSSKLDLMALGDSYASGLGINVKVYRFLFLLLASLLASAVISYAGVLGFVGLIVPHMGRRIVGNNHKLLLPFSALLGACLVTLCDTLTRVLFRPYEVPCGILIAVLGVPFFIYLLLRRKN